MPKTPKYKLDPLSSLEYAKKKGRLREQDEKIFYKDPEIALRYGIEVVKGQLPEGLHNLVCDYYLRCCKLWTHYPDKTILDDDFEELMLRGFIIYISNCDNFPNKEEFFENVSPPTLCEISRRLQERLPEKFENVLFDYVIDNNDLELVTKYHALFYVKFPERIHNYLLSQYLTELNSTQKHCLNYYFSAIDLNKNLFKKIFSRQDPNMTIKDFFEQNF